ncbi:MAG: arsenate reductase (azurin) small subunit [Planctomycetes bacterium]|nr:arsenate reductase (azurin) small subunit [Planctomycetota bacterium]
MNEQRHTSAAQGAGFCPRAISRRQMLLGGGSAVAVVVLGALPGGTLAGLGDQIVKLASYPRRKIGTISGLGVGQPVALAYPYDDTRCMLVKLGVAAGGGVGPENDIVCFTTICTHMGGPLEGTYKPEHQVLGACPMHLTTFDLTRHGMVVSGHATESLPQIVLETDGDDLYAVGVMGLIYGHSANLDLSAHARES